MPQRWIYFFGNGQADGSSDLKHLIGGKGASLADMTRAGLNVPPGFTISAECCEYFYRNQPLLVAVRSGAAHSMPGMMDTVLNIGLNPACVRAMGERTTNARGAWQA